MRRIIRGKPLLIVAAAATIAGCSDSHVQMDASIVSGNLAVVDVGPPDAGRPDASIVSGNLLVIDAGPPPDTGNDTGATADADVDSGPDGGP